MFESDIERSKITLMERLLTAQPFVYLRDVVNNPAIEYAYKQYFDAEFGWWLYEEQMLRHANPHLDVHDTAVRDLLQELDMQYRRTARFDREQMTGIADAAVKSVLNYRIRPRTTLKWFVFRGEPTKAIYEVYLRMRYFADYSYLHEGFHQWLLQRGLQYDSMDILSVLEFEKLIKKIDDDTILELSPIQFVALINPIFTMLADSNVEPEKQVVPIEAIIVFLDDKEIHIIAQKLERMLYQKGIRYMSKEMFLQVVDEVLNEVDVQEQDANTDVNLTPELPKDSILTELGDNVSTAPVLSTTPEIAIPLTTPKQAETHVVPPLLQEADTASVIGSESVIEQESETVSITEIESVPDVEQLSIAEVEVTTTPEQESKVATDYNHTQPSPFAEEAGIAEAYYHEEQLTDSSTEAESMPLPSDEETEVASVASEIIEESLLSQVELSPTIENISGEVEQEEDTSETENEKIPALGSGMSVSDTIAAAFAAFAGKAALPFEREIMAASGISAAQQEIHGVTFEPLAEPESSEESMDADSTDSESAAEEEYLSVATEPLHEDVPTENIASEEVATGAEELQVEELIPQEQTLTQDDAIEVEPDVEGISSDEHPAADYDTAAAELSESLETTAESAIPSSVNIAELLKPTSSIEADANTIPTGIHLTQEMFSDASRGFTHGYSIVAHEQAETKVMSALLEQEFQAVPITSASVLIKVPSQEIVASSAAIDIVENSVDDSSPIAHAVINPADGEEPIAEKLPITLSLEEPAPVEPPFVEIEQSVDELGEQGKAVEQVLQPEHLSPEHIEQDNAEAVGSDLTYTTEEKVEEVEKPLVADTQEDSALTTLPEEMKVADVEETATTKQATMQEDVPEITPAEEMASGDFTRIEKIEENKESLFTKMQEQTPATDDSMLKRLDALVAEDEHVSEQQAVVNDGSKANGEILGIITRVLGNQTDATNSAETEKETATLESERSALGKGLASLLSPEAQELIAPQRPSVASFVDGKQRDSFIKKLCHKDELRYDGLIAKLDRATKWKEALAFLDQFYAEEGVDPQSSTARDLRMAVYKRFVTN